MADRAAVPRPWIATYRLQVHAHFTLADAAQVLPYLASLGVSHVYLSPCLQASRGSRHGYDVTDPRHIAEDLGGEAAWRRFVTAARSHSLGILLDIVPNHMAATEQNPWWDDVLAHGPFSPYCPVLRHPVARAQSLLRTYLQPGEAVRRGHCRRRAAH